MAPLKASGKDDFPALFYQNYWHIIGTEVENYCFEVFNRRKDIPEINETCIVLIPKVTTSINMGQFRPISLCNVLYKSISKVLVNHFQQVLSGCIDESQGAFVANR